MRHNLITQTDFFKTYLKIQSLADLYSFDFLHNCKMRKKILNIFVLLNFSLKKSYDLEHERFQSYEQLNLQAGCPTKHDRHDS